MNQTTLMEKLNGKKEKITTIEFNQTANILLNSGIIALDHYLEEFKNLTNIEYIHKLTERKLFIESKNLFRLLEEVYYFMGREVYDTSGEKADKEAGKYYFIKEPFAAKAFSKMKSYGLAELITNDPTPSMNKYGRKIKFDKLIKEDTEFALSIAKFLREKGKKIKYYSFINNELHETEIDPNTKKRKENRGGESEIYIDSPYTKTTLIKLDDKYFIKGKAKCYLTGEKYNKLVDVTCSSPFLAGIRNFNSCLSSKDKKISWKAMYLSRFSPKFSFHSYASGLDTLYIYMLSTDNILNLKTLYQNNKNLFKDRIALKQSNYHSNMRVYNFVEGKDSSKDLTEQNEFLFMLIYSFYKNLMEKNSIEIETATDDWDPFENSIYKSIPVSIVMFKTDKFAATMRPDAFDEINNFKWIIRLIAYLEKHKISVYKLLRSLKFIKLSEKTSQNKYRLERQIRNRVLGKIIKGKSILGDVENLFYDCFRYKTTNDSVGFKSYKDLFMLVQLYEKITLFGGNSEMTEILQQKAISLGKSIGQGILHFEGGQDLFANAKAGKNYIISLKKARTLQQFLDEIIRIQTKYGISVSNDILNSITQKNFIMIKQFSIISALNQINSIYIKKGGE